MLSGHLCRCTGYEPIVDGDRARRRRRREPRPAPCSPRPSATRTPRRCPAIYVRRAARRAPRGSPAALGPRARRAPRGRARQPRRDRAPLLGGAVVRRRLRPALVAGRRRTTSTTASRTAAPRRRRSRDGRSRSRTAPEHPGALDLDEREPSLMLYTSGTTGRPRACRARTAPTARRGLSRRSSTATLSATARSE